MNAVSLPELLGLTASEEASALGRYTVRSVLGQGGMGKVYLGYDHKLDRDVAIKVLAQDDGLSEDRRAVRVKRFYREAKSLAALTHPNVIRLFDYSGPQSQVQYVVMERLRGVGLETFIPGEPLPEAVALSILHDAALALSEAHQNGIIHRDIKPDNIHIERNGRVVVLDFGLALGVNDDAMRATFSKQGTAIVGTPRYSSPEQLTGKDLSDRSDVFSLGSLAYAMLSGLPAFPDETISELMHSVPNSEPMALSMIAPLQTTAAELVAHMMRKNPNERPSAREVAERLQPLLLDLRVASPASMVEAFLRTQPLPQEQHGQPIQAPPKSTLPRANNAKALQATTLLSPAKPKPRIPLSTLVVILALIAIALLILTKPKDEPQNSQEIHGNLENNK